MLLLLALACETATPASDDTDTGNPADTGTNDTAETGDTGDTDTEDTGDTDTADSDDADADGYLASEDCDDNDDAIHPGAVETCDDLDNNCDGSIDEGAASVALLVEGPGDGSITQGIWYGYDADDNAVLVGGDIDRDGVLNNFARTEWADGFFVATERSNDGTTVIERIEYDRNAEGRIIEGRIDEDGDGDWDYSYGYTYTDGFYTGYWYDFGDDGTYESSYEYTLNADGLPTHYWEDADGDGTYDVETNYIYEGDHLLSASTDTDGDGVFDILQTNTWEGDRLMETFTTGGAYPYPYRQTYSFTDADDYWDTMDIDYSDDGAIDYRSTQTVDADGTITGQTSDQYADGIDVYGATYEVDADGNIRNSSYLDGVLTSVVEYDYDDKGVLSDMRQDSNGDGAWEYVYEYDAFGHLIYQMYDSPSDGVIDTLQEWSYDERGRRLGATIDNLGDGVYEWEQWAPDGYACGSK